MRTAIVMTYLNRQIQLNRTLESFQQYDPKRFFVVIVDDGSDKEIILPEKSPFDIAVIRMRGKCWTQGDPAYNAGLYYALQAKPDLVIIQNAECYHHGDILGFAQHHVTDKNYITFGCFSIDRQTWEAGADINEVITANNKGAMADLTNAWYNHSIHRPKAYHFCAAMTADNMRKINGFDERFSFGTGFDDDYLLHQIRTLGLDIYIANEPFVVHQWHEHTKYPFPEQALLNINYRLFQELVKENEYRARHYFTPDLV